MRPATESDAPALALVGVALAKAGGHIDRWSRLFALLTLLAAWLLAPAADWRYIALFTLGLIAAGGQCFFALRLAFDQPVFAAWAADAAADTAAFDRALATAGLRAAPAGARPLADRVRGLRRLVFRQAACFALQIACMMALFALCPLSAQP